MTEKEAELIEGCKRGIEKYCKLLFNTYYGTMLGVCRRYAREQEEAKDILQEGFMKIFKNIKQYKKAGSFEGWMKRIMVNTAIDHYKKNNIRNITEYLDESEEEAASISDCGDSMEQPLSPEFLLVLVQKLPTVYRMVFNLHVIEDYSHREIGEILGINESTSRSNLSKAKNHLRNQLKEFKQENRISYAG
jgi:RNA polymerase sigma factor (sigma-70 family)